MFINLIFIYVLIVIVHLLLLKMKEIEEMKKTIQTYSNEKNTIKEPVNKPKKEPMGIEIKESFNEYDETLMKKDLLSFINDPQPSTLMVDQKQEFGELHKHPQIDEQNLEVIKPHVKDNRLLAIDTLEYENDKEINTGKMDNGLMAYDTMDFGYSTI